MSPSAVSAAPQKPICTICYEDLKPLVEHLQCISICGHVFHELCLQQWLEYCPAGKKPTCPVCKQSCSHHSPTRLYFQSTGDATSTQTTTTSSVSQQPSSGPDAEALAAEVRRLELKLSSLTASFETQQTLLKKLNDEVSGCKELAKREEAKREEIKKEKECVEQFLRVKIEELTRKSSECTKLEERSLGLAKELAALKLATDLNLGEEEMVKLASLGHGSNHKNAVDVLKRSLALRNKSYKELMAQCNLLGRAETRSRQNLDKAEEKIRKLKTRLQELEKAFEDKENGILRDLKASKKHKAERLNSNFIRQNVKLPCGGDPSTENHSKKITQLAADFDEAVFSNYDLHNLSRSSGGLEFCDGLASPVYNNNNCVKDLEDDASTFDEDGLKHCPSLYDDLNRLYDHKNQSELYGSAGVQKRSSCGQDVSSCPKREAYSTFRESNVSGGSWNPGISMKDKTGNMDKHEERSQLSSTWVKEVLLIDNITKKTPLAEHIMEVQTQDAAAGPGDQCYSGAFGPNGVNRSMGKWCRQVLKRQTSSPDMQASKGSGGLIAVGADGRGGRVKILRTHDRFLGSKAQTLCPKKSKCEANRACQPQIEHFFGKAKV